MLKWLAAIIETIGEAIELRDQVIERFGYRIYE
jgi:hypothetical protein